MSQVAGLSSHRISAVFSNRDLDIYSRREISIRTSAKINIFAMRKTSVLVHPLHRPQLGFDSSFTDLQRIFQLSVLDGCISPVLETFTQHHRQRFTEE